MPNDPSTPLGDPNFAPTQWTLVLAAGNLADTTGADAALAHLCTTYWFPLYAFVRRQGHHHHDAQDLTQAFFGKLLEKNYIRDADRTRGRFRTFLLASLKHFLANEWDKRAAKKRGGGITFVPIDADASDRFDRETAALASSESSAEDLYDRRWAQTVVDNALAALRRNYEANGQAALFDALRPVLTGGKGAVPYAAVAADLDLQENAVKVAAHRLRGRFRTALRDQIADTVAGPDEVETEFDHLRQILTNS